MYKTECSYDPNAVEASQRKSSIASSGVKRSASAIPEPTSAEYLIERLLSLSESEAIEAVCQLRSNGDVDAVADALRKHVKLTDTADTSSAEGDQLDVKGDLAIDQLERLALTFPLIYTRWSFSLPLQLPLQCF